MSDTSPSSDNSVPLKNSNQLLIILTLSIGVPFLFLLIGGLLCFYWYKRMKQLVNQVQGERSDCVECGGELVGGVVRDLDGRETPVKQWTGTRVISHDYARASRGDGVRDIDKGDDSEGAKIDIGGISGGEMVQGSKTVNRNVASSESHIASVDTAMSQTDHPSASRPSLRHSDSSETDLRSTPRSKRRSVVLAKKHRSSSNGLPLPGISTIEIIKPEKTRRQKKVFGTGEVEEDDDTTIGCGGMTSNSGSSEEVAGIGVPQTTLFSDANSTGQIKRASRGYFTAPTAVFLSPQLTTPQKIPSHPSLGPYRRQTMNLSAPNDPEPMRNSSGFPSRYESLPSASPPSHPDSNTPIKSLPKSPSKDRISLTQNQLSYLKVSGERPRSHPTSSTPPRNPQPLSSTPPRHNNRSTSSSAILTDFPISSSAHQRGLSEGALAAKSSADLPYLKRSETNRASEGLQTKSPALKVRGSRNSVREEIREVQKGPEYDNEESELEESRSSITSIMHEGTFRGEKFPHPYGNVRTKNEGVFQGREAIKGRSMIDSNGSLLMNSQFGENDLILTNPDAYNSSFGSSTRRTSSFDFYHSKGTRSAS